MNESVTATELIKMINLKDADELRSWLHPLIDKGLVVSSDVHSKSKEYRINPAILKDSNYKGRTSLKRIEDYRLKELIIEDLKIYEEASLADIRQRIGEEIHTMKIWRQLQILIEEGKVVKTGAKRWQKYKIVE